MKYIVGREKFKLNNTVVTLGKFDGIHLGHRLLIDESIRSKEKGLTSVLFTFMQDESQLYIYNEEEKRNIIKELGIDVCIVYPFDNETKQMTPKEFIEKILIEQLGVKKIVVGKDFRFGKDRQGDVELLNLLSKEYGYELKVYEKKKDEHGIDISSRRIRDHIVKSDIETVTKLLGRLYSFSGCITTGRQIGRTIGFPTINIEPHEHKILPCNGVYESKVVFYDEPTKSYIGITNIGNKPTIESGLSKNIETHILDFNQNVYGKNVCIYLKRYIREEMKFSGIEELKETIKKDKEEVIRKQKS